MRALIALAGLLALSYPAAAAASIYDFSYSVHYAGLPDNPFYFSLDTSEGALNKSGYTEFFDVARYAEDGSALQAISELDITATSVTAIDYESSGVNDVFYLFFESDGGSISSGEGANIQFVPGEHNGGTAEGRAIFPASLNISTAAAPEPQTWLLTAAGVALAGWALRRRRELVAPA